VYTLLYIVSGRNSGFTSSFLKILYSIILVDYFLRSCEVIDLGLCIMLIAIDQFSQRHAPYSYPEYYTNGYLLFFYM